MTKSSSSNTVVQRRAGVLVVGIAVVALVSTLSAVNRADAATAPIGLGTASSFVVLAGSGVTNTGTTWGQGDVGSFPTPSETGFDTATWTGVNHAGDAVTEQAKIDLTTAYNQAAHSDPTTAVATELGGRTLTPGVYGGDTLGITGTLTLNTLGDPNAVFVFKAASTLITASSSQVNVLNGGTACNVFWQVGSSATLGTTSHLIGTVMASTSITATTGATIEGRLLAQTGAVTLDHNTITRATCAATTPTTANDGTPAQEGGTPTTTSGGTPTTLTVVGLTPTVPTLPLVSTGGTPTGSTPGLTPDTPGGPTPSTPTTSQTSPPSLIPGLPRTGIDERWLLASAALIMLGGSTVGAANARRRRILDASAGPTGGRS